VTSIAPSSDYSDLDFDALRVRIRNLISGAFPLWTDFNVANFGNTLVDLWCFVGDVATKRIDGAALNSRWTTATQLQAVLAACKLINYVPQGQTAAQVEETFTIASTAPGDVVFPAGTTVTTLDVGAPVTYQLLAPLTIPAGTTAATGLVENSTSETDTFDSTGLLAQAVTLSQSPFLQTSETVMAGQGQFARVANFLSSDPSDLVYTVSVDASGVATLTFGNGIEGALPTGNITVSYKYGGGSAGTVQPGTLGKISGSFTDVYGNPVQVSVANVLASSPAQDAQSLASIQQLAPLSIRPAGRAIARDDYTDVALQVPGVARALMLFNGQNPAVAVNQGVLSIVTPNATPASAAVLAAVTAAFVGTPYAQTLDLLIVSSQLLVVNVQTTIFKSSGTTGPQAKAAVLAALQYFFSPLVPPTNLAGNPNANAGAPNPSLDFGYNLQDENGNPTGTLDWSDIYDAIRNAGGIRKVGAGATGLTLNGVAVDPGIGLAQFPTLGTVEIIDGDTNQVL
jgi:hypothetical protein